MNTYSPKLKLSIINGIDLSLTLQGNTKRYLFHTALLFYGLSLINPLPSNQEHGRRERRTGVLCCLV